MGKIAMTTPLVEMDGDEMTQSSENHQRGHWAFCGFENRVL